MGNSLQDKALNPRMGTGIVKRNRSLGQKKKKKVRMGLHAEVTDFIK